MKYLLDIHCHTIASGHAYSTITENAEAAKKKGIELIGLCDHAPKMPGGACKLHFLNLKSLPERISGVEVLKCSELNLLDAEGSVDLPERILKELDVNIASFHMPCIKPMSRAENTRCLLNAMNNPYINIIGHPGDPRYPVDVEKIVLASKKTGTLLEMNNSSLNPESTRVGSDEIMKEILICCKENNVPVILGSDSHYMEDVGNFKRCESLIKEVGFSEDLILNTSVRRFKEFLKLKK